MHFSTAPQLRPIPRLLPVEDPFPVRPLVTAGLVINDPAFAIGVGEAAVDDEASPFTIQDRRKSMFVARIGLRAEQPEAALVGEGVDEFRAVFVRHHQDVGVTHNSLRVNGLWL